MRSCELRRESGIDLPIYLLAGSVFSKMSKYTFKISVQNQMETTCSKQEYKMTHASNTGTSKRALSGNSAKNATEDE